MLMQVPDRSVTLRKHLVRTRAVLADDRRAVSAVLLTFVLLLAVTVWMWRSTTLETAQVANERFGYKFSEAQIEIQQRLQAYEQILRGAVALFAASTEVTRDEWRAYVRTLQIEKNFLGIQGIGFSERVVADRLEVHLQKIRSEGFPDYTVRPAGARAEYAPLVYIEPFDWRNMRAFGYDMLAEPALRQTLQRARDTGAPSVSGKVKLEQETGDGVQHGFVMCLPVFGNGAATSTVEERRAALAGHVCSTFRMDDLMQGILGPETLPNIRLRIFDGAEAIPASLMYDTLDGADETVQTPSFAADQAFEFNGRTWTLRFDSLPAFDATIDLQKARSILVGGLLISALFAAVVWSLLLNRRRASELAQANSGLQTEIAERTKLEGELERAKDVAEAANQAKSDFLANVSHELRTPLTMILGPVEQLLATERPMASWRTQLDRVQRNALLLLNRVSEILDFAKAEAGKFDLCWEAVDLSKVIGTLAGDAAVVAERKGCVLTWLIDPALGSVCLDPRLFEKITMNLVNNAIKFTHTGGTIQLEATALQDGCFEFAVQDSGIGIAVDKLPLLFERFSQVDHAATRHYGGTGIGLALVKELVELMGGKAGVESEAGRGSRFFVRLPRNEDKCATPAHKVDTGGMPQTATEVALRRLRLQDDDATGEIRATEGEPRPQDTVRPRIMVVDDSPDILNYITELLGDECDIVSAADGELAWALLQRSPVEAVLSDVMMPNLDGFGLTARIKASANFSHVPVILLTARGGSDASVAGLEGGADDYIAKPFSPAELKARVRAVLRMGRMQSELRDKSRQAGMAQIATNVLHNVGNVLNSVNISAGLVSSRVRDSKARGLAKAVQLINDHAADLGDYLTRDEKGKLLPGYLNKLAAALAEEQQGVVEELELLARSVDHIKDIVATQQSHAGAASVVEAVRIQDLLEDALRMNAGSLARHQVMVVKDFADVPVLLLDKHLVLQILVNLISNAKQAMGGTIDRPHHIALRANVAELADGRRLRIDVEDDGEGIAPENLARVFTHGFTTRKNGHGFGLHSCVLAAKEMGGTLTAQSEGPGKGAVFTLELPIKTAGDRQ
jgi:signal transduction histidine kinase